MISGYWYWYHQGKGRHPIRKLNSFFYQHFDLWVKRNPLHPQKSWEAEEMSSCLRQKPPSPGKYIFLLLFQNNSNRNCVETKCVEDLLGDIVFADRVLKSKIKPRWVNNKTTGIFLIVRQLC